MVIVAKVWCEHHETNTIGIGTIEPRISWALTGDNSDKDWEQKRYEIIIQHQDGSVKSTTVNSSDSRLVPWPSRPLASSESATIQVRVTGTDGQVSSWSTPTVVETGLLHPQSWQGCLLVEPDESTEQAAGKHRPVTFRRQFAVPAGVQIARARLYITAHGIYNACINGHRVGDQLLAPGWTSYQQRLVYQTYDIAPQLIACQDNEIQVDVAEGWFCGSLGFARRSNIYGNRLGLLAIIHVELEDGQILRISTDDRWRWTFGGIVEAGLLDGETYDMRASLSIQQPGSISWKRVQTSPYDFDRLVAPDGPPIRKTQDLQVQQVLRSPSGKPILDFGQNFVGWMRVQQMKGPAGAQIRFRFAEVLENGEIGTRPLRSAKCQDTVILDGTDAGIRSWEPKFTFHGFRYVEIDGWPDATIPLVASNFVGVVIHSDIARTGQFRCSNPLLNRLHENIVWSMRGNFVGIPTDCPQRDERLGWTGDLNVFGETASYLYDVSGMLSSWLKDLIVEQSAAGGVVPLVIPYILGDIGPGKAAEAIWGDVAVMLPWTLYQATGDKLLLSRQYPSMKAWLRAIPRSSTTGLWQVSGHKLADWLDPSAPPDDPANAMTDMYLVCDAFLVHVTTLVAQIAAVLDNYKEEASEYAAQAQALRHAFATEYITPSGRLACDTQTAYALAIHFDLLPTAEQQRHAVERLALLIRQRSRFKISTGFAGTPYLGHSLTKVGMANVFYRMLLHRERPSWLYPVTMGATTVWERWDSMLPDGSINPGDMTSFNHYAFGSVASWMHRSICGLRPVEPGWKVFAVEPVPGGGLRWAEAEYQSAFGFCRVRWEIRNGYSSGCGNTQGEEEEEAQDIADAQQQQRFWLQVLVPPNTKCQVRLPGSSELLITGSGCSEWEIGYFPQEWPVRALQPPFRPPDDQIPDDPVLEHGW
ncbi:bacterial alpha-L-rhamnosidase domain protein [Aspergillus granulosus]|uniref:alpha-L-rhamnosidase n=1 Tax=Aspergillus granulosus TaxID=176169 RepID=A0ABR4H492_9EURO